jgi:DNA-binding MarR family transcriptional regulator
MVDIEAARSPGNSIMQGRRLWINRQTPDAVFHCPFSHGAGKKDAQISLLYSRKETSLLRPKNSRALAKAKPAASGQAVIDIRRVEMRRRVVERSFDAEDKHAYFEGVAEARYVLRRVFRLVGEQAKLFGLDPLEHQALIQIYGSSLMQLRVNELADRLGIVPAFASNLCGALAAKQLVSRARGKSDQRVTIVSVTESGRKLLHAIDAAVKVHVDYFAQTLSPKEREAALSILMFYVGATLSPSVR